MVRELIWPLDVLLEQQVQEEVKEEAQGEVEEELEEEEPRKRYNLRERKPVDYQEY